MYEQLTTGKGFWEDPLKTDEDFREAWARWGDEIVERMKTHYPGRELYVCTRLGLPQPLLGDDEP